MSKNCRQCNKEMNKRGSFCDRKCSGVFQRKGVIKVCEATNCLNTFYVKKYKKNGKYCSRLCANREIKKGYKLSDETKAKIGLANSGIKISKKCPYCDALFSVNTSNVNRVYCSQICFGKYIVGSNNPRWKGGKENKSRLTVARRALHRNASGSYTTDEWINLKKKYNYMCLCCKKSEPEIRLSVDHIIPLIKGGSNDISNIQPLCTSCNSRKHVKTINFISLYAV